MVQMATRRKMKERGRRHSSQRRKGSSYLAQFRRRFPSSERSSASRSMKVKKSWSATSDRRSLSSSSSYTESTSSSGSSRERRDTRGRRRHQRSRRVSPVRSQESLESDESSYSQSSTSTSQSPEPVHSLDTLDNSESKLQDIGLVVRASDLSDYSDLFTLDSDEKEEFEDFVEKYDEGVISNVHPVLSQDSAAYSLPHNESRVVNATPSRDEGGCGNCVIQTFFCLDEESVQGSYGGLRNDEVLIAESFQAGSCSHDVEQSFGVDSNSMTSPELEKTVESSPSRSTSDSIEIKYQGSEGDNEVESPSNARWGWSCFSSWPFQQNLDDQSETQTIGAHQNGEEDVEEASGHSHTIVWERSIDSTRTYEDSVGDDRAADIVKKARTDNILSKFKTDDPPIPHDTTREVPSGPLCTTFVIGDNARVSGVAEIEAGDGDTAFVVFLEATRDGMTTRGQAAAMQADSFQGDHVRRTARSLTQHDSERSSTSDIIIVGEKPSTGSSKVPTLILEDSADSFLEQLGLLSEASYFCLDEKKQELVRSHFQAQIGGNELRDSNIVATTPSASCSISAAPGAQYMFCIRSEDLRPHDSSPSPSRDVKREDLPFDEFLTEVAPPVSPRPLIAPTRVVESKQVATRKKSDVSTPGTEEGCNQPERQGSNRVRAGVHNYRRYLEIKRETKHPPRKEPNSSRKPSRHIQCDPANHVERGDARKENPSHQPELLVSMNPKDVKPVKQTEKQAEKVTTKHPSPPACNTLKDLKSKSTSPSIFDQNTELETPLLTTLEMMTQKQQQSEKRDCPEKICTTKPDRQNRLSYEELTRLSRKLLLSDEPSPPACMLKATNVSFSSSSDEFFDAVSRTSSILSVD